MSLVLNSGFKVLETKTRETILIQTTSSLGNAVQTFCLKSPLLKCIILILVIHFCTLNCHINMNLYERPLPSALFKGVTVLVLLGLHGQVLGDYKGVWVLKTNKFF